MDIIKNDELQEIYDNVKLIDLTELLSRENINTLKKLGYTVNIKYSEKEFKKMLNDLIIDYYINPERVTSPEDLPRKNLNEIEVSRESYNKLIKNLDEIDVDVVSNISVVELNKRQDIRRKTIILLIKTIVKNKDKDLFPYNQLSEILNLSKYGKQSLKDDIDKIKKSINKDKKIKELVKKYSI